MPLEIDHIFITCKPNAPEADALLRYGFVEGARNTHPGQGTANRRFFFENFMLELLWLENKDEATSPLTRRTKLWERCTQVSANPFGLIIRPDGQDSPAVPFPTWSYQPNYLPANLAIEIADGTALCEPELFYLPFAGRRVSNEPSNHTLPMRRVTNIKVGFPGALELTAASRSASDAHLVQYFFNPEPVIEIFFEGEGALIVDLRPELPLVLRTEVSARATKI